MIKELSNGYYIDAWWDKYSGNYIIQVKNKSGDEVAVNVVGNKEDRDVIIKDFTDEFMRGNLTEDIEDISDTPDVLEIGTHVQVNPDVKSKVSGEFGVIKGLDDNKYMIEFDVMPGSTVSFSRHELVVMDDDEELLEEKLFSKKKKKLPALDTLHPLEIIPDAAAGIDSFNNNNSVNNSEGGNGEAMGEALHVNNTNDKIYIAPKGKTLSWYKNEIKKHKPDYNFNRLNKVEANRKPYVAYMILDRILKQEELDNAQIDMANDHKNMTNNYSDDNDVNYGGDSFFKNGIEFESEEAAREYFGEGKIMPNKKSEKYYWNIMHEAYDIVEENVPKRKLNESLTKQKKVSLKECLKNRDREDFDKLSECYELEMFYEAVEKDLSKEDVEAIKNYANDKRNSSEEVAAYIKGKLDEEIEGGSFKARLNNVKMMHEVMKSMNNENAYGSWIYTMPDCPDESDFEWFAEDKDEYKDLVDTFNRIYNRYKKDGLYKPSEEVLDFLRYSGYGDVEVFESLNESSDGWFEADWEVLKNSLSPEAYNLLDDITSSNMSQVYTNSTGQYKYGDEYDDYIFDSLGELENSLRYDLNQRDELGESLNESAAVSASKLLRMINSCKTSKELDKLYNNIYNAPVDSLTDSTQVNYSAEEKRTIEDAFNKKYDKLEESLNGSKKLNESMLTLYKWDVDWGTFENYGDDSCSVCLTDDDYNTYRVELDKYNDNWEVTSVENVDDNTIYDNIRLWNSDIIKELKLNESLNEAMNYVSLADLIDWVSEHEQATRDIERYYGKALDDMNTDEILDWIYDHEQLTKDYENHFGLMSESLNEEIEQSKEAIIEEINNLVLNSGFELDSNIRHENPSVGFNGSSMHWQVVRKDYEFTSADGQDGLRELADPLVQSLDAFENKHGNDFAVTWNFGVDRENHVTCGFDVRSASRGFFNN